VAAASRPRSAQPGKRFGLVESRNRKPFKGLFRVFVAAGFEVQPGGLNGLPVLQRRPARYGRQGLRGPLRIAGPAVDSSQQQQCFRLSFRLQEVISFLVKPEFDQRGAERYPGGRGLFFGSGQGVVIMSLVQAAHAEFPSRGGKAVLGFIAARL